MASFFAGNEAKYFEYNGLKFLLYYFPNEGGVTEAHGPIPLGWGPLDNFLNSCIAVSKNKDRLKAEQEVICQIIAKFQVPGYHESLSKNDSL